MTLPELFEATCNFDYTQPNWEAAQMDLIHKAIESDRVCYLPEDWIEKAEAEAASMETLKKEILDAKSDKADKSKDSKDKDSEDEDSDSDKESDKPADEKTPVEKPKDPTLADTGKSALKKAAELLRLVADTFEKADAAHNSLAKASGSSPADELEARAAEILK